MSLNKTPSAERIHISFFGCANAGKSSLLNAITNQRIAIVSECKGTTTDPVSKAVELLPAGPVVITDTPGLDDTSQLGAQRIEAALKVLGRTDVAVLAIDQTVGMSDEDAKLKASLEERKIPYIIAYTKADLPGSDSPGTADGIRVSSVTGEGIEALRNKIAELAMAGSKDKPLVRDLVSRGDLVVLVIPIDESAPKGRLILPQQQVIRDLLEAGAIPVVTKDTELQLTMDRLGDSVRMVITDSQAFAKVSEVVPAEIPLTSFSVLMSRYKGNLDFQLECIGALDALSDGDEVLVAEGCSHNIQCGDIGREKIPAMIKDHTGKNLKFAFASGVDFPENLEGCSLIVHCGGCMLNEKEMQRRIGLAKAANVPITNYGMIIAKATGLLDRSIEAIKIGNK